MRNLKTLRKLLIQNNVYVLWSVELKIATNETNVLHCIIVDRFVFIASSNSVFLYSSCPVY